MRRCPTGSISNSIYLNVCDVAVYAETRLQGETVPTLFTHSPVFCASAPREHNYFGGLAVVVASHFVGEKMFSIVFDLFQLTVANISASELTGCQRRLTLLATSIVCNCIRACHQ